MPTSFWGIPLIFWPWIIFVGFMLAAVIYVSPALVAMARGHRNRFAILILNILLGWTVVGWVFVLIWSLAGGDRPVLGKTDVVTLEVLGDGTFVWNGQRVADAEGLDRLWKSVAAQDPQPEIHLKPNRDAKYEHVERALKGAQSNGVYKFGFVGNLAPEGW
jgi:hypothetical protein